MAERDGSVVLDGPEGVARFRALQNCHALAAEVEGRQVMRHLPGSTPMLNCKAICGSPRRTKRGVLRDMVAFMREWFGYEPTESITRAMGKR